MTIPEITDVPASIMVTAMETLMGSKAKLEFAGTDEIEILAQDIGVAILAAEQRGAASRPRHMQRRRPEER